jgi:hypothetical protein
MHESQRHRQPHEVPKTRKELVWYLWNRGRTECNLVKEGPFYAAWVGTQIRATHARRIDAGSFEWWETTHFYRRHT